MRKNLENLIEHLQMTQKEFSEAIGISPSAINQLIKGKSKGLKSDTIVRIVEKFNVNPTWLLTGEGEMFLRTGRDMSVQEAGLPTGQAGSRRDRIIAALGAEEEEAINDFIEYRAIRAGVDTSLIKEAQKDYLPELPVAEEDTVAVPVLGRIAAGAPMLAEENVETMLAIPKRWLNKRNSRQACPSGRRGNYFGLRVRGVSMLGAGILDGDLAVLSAVDSPLEETKSGDIVAALINGEATLKRISFEQGGRVILFPENPKFKPIELLEEDAVLVQGKLVLLLREYGDEE